MFFRDYKSKIVKGIDEDDLLEGNLKEHTKRRVTWHRCPGDTLRQCQCGQSHRSRMDMLLLSNVAEELPKYLFNWQLNIMIFYLCGFIVIWSVSSFHHMACFISECHDTEKIMLFQNIIDLSKHSFSVMGVRSQIYYYIYLKLTRGFFSVYYRKYLICGMI